MSSINTNPGAMTALQTLRATSKALDTTQNRISTGYRVSEASHNAAYWSLATTMRSDNKAMSTVKDALGLGAAQVDVAYTAMDTVKDTLDQIKSKLVAASAPDVDKAKIQAEISQLQNDLKTYAKSATFSGGNWLDVESTGTQKVVASFVRTGDAVSLQTIDVNTANIALFVGGTGGTGILEGIADLTVPGDDDGGGGEVEEAPDVSAYSAASTTVADGANEDFTFSDFTTLDWAAGDTVSFTIDVDGTDVEVTGTFDGTDWTFDHTDPTDVTISFDTSGDDLVVNVANATGGDFDVAIGDFTSTRPADDAGGGGDTVAIDLSSVTAPATATVADGSNVDFEYDGFADIEWQEGDTIAFTIDVDGTDVEVTGSFDGTTWTFDHTDPTDVTITFDTSAGLSINVANATGGDFDVGFGDITGSRAAEEGEGEDEDGVTVTNFDITDMSRDEIEMLIKHVDGVLGKVTSAASELGSIKTRISSQAEFVGKIMDAVDRGISQLVDANMEEESTRLQALQIQQQLGIQALSIANSNSQMILSLFR